MRRLPGAFCIVLYQQCRRALSGLALASVTIETGLRLSFISTPAKLDTIETFRMKLTLKRFETETACQFQFQCFFTTLAVAAEVLVSVLCKTVGPYPSL